IAGNVARPRQKTGVVLAGRLDPRGNVWGIPQQPHLLACADRQPPRIDGESHRLVERTNERGESWAIGPYRQQLVGLVGADQERRAQLVQQRDEAVGLSIVKRDRLRRRATLVAVRSAILIPKLSLGIHGCE